MLDKIFQKANGRNILISSENFDRLEMSEISILSELLEKYEYEVNLIFVKRNFYELLLSNWEEEVKFGYCKSFIYFIYAFVSESKGAKFEYPEEKIMVG